MNSIEAYQKAIEKTEEKLKLIYTLIGIIADRGEFEGAITIEVSHSQLNVILRHLNLAKYKVLGTSNTKDGLTEIRLNWDRGAQNETSTMPHEN
jgi:hypothetical protein